MSVLTDLPSLKTHLGISPDSNDEDDLLEDLIDAIDEVIANDISRGRVPGNHPLSSVEDTEYYDGHNREELILRRRPVTAIARLAVDAGGYYGKGTDAFPTSSDWTEGEDFVSFSLEETEDNPGILISLRGRNLTSSISREGIDSDRGVWPRGRGNILVKYTAGYTTIPRDLKLVANMLIAATWNSADLGMGGPVSSMRLGDEAFKLLKTGEGSGQEIATINRILAKYKE